jgi:hypothetical protein
MPERGDLLLVPFSFSNSGRGASFAAAMLMRAD